MVSASALDLLLMECNSLFVTVGRNGKEGAPKKELAGAAEGDGKESNVLVLVATGYWIMDTGVDEGTDDNG